MSEVAWENIFVNYIPNNYNIALGLRYEKSTIEVSTSKKSCDFAGIATSYIGRLFCNCMNKYKLNRGSIEAFKTT